jgi:hypothetical protein
MFESDGVPEVPLDDRHAAALARMHAILPPRPSDIPQRSIAAGPGPTPHLYTTPPRSSRSSSVPLRGHEDAVRHSQPGHRLPGPTLARALKADDPSALSSYELLEATAGWERLIAWAQAKQIDVIAEFARRRPSPSATDEPGPRISEFAADEIAARLRISRRAADLKLAIALDLADCLPATRQALLEGRIDLSKARAIADHTANLADPARRRAVEERVLRRAESQTAPELRRSLLRAVAAVDSAAVVKRHAKARAERFLALYPMPDGMAEITALLPADDATVVFNAIEALARCSDAADPRGIEARRADALVDLCRSALAPAERAQGRNSRRRRRGLRIQVTVAATTLLGLDDQAGELSGYGPIPAVMARRIAADPDATWQRLLTDPVSGVLLDYGITVYRPPPSLARHVRARDQVCAFPGCRQPAERCDLDHREHFPDGPTSADNLGPLCRHHHRAKTVGGWSWRRARDGTVTWSAPTGHEYEAPTPAVIEGCRANGDDRTTEAPPF